MEYGVLQTHSSIELYTVSTYSALKIVFMHGKKNIIFWNIRLSFWLFIEKFPGFRKRGSVWECLNHPWIFPRIPNDILSRQSNEIHMDNLRNYQARKRWKVRPRE